MYELQAIETINSQPLAAATDRLLLHWGRPSWHAPGTDQISPDRTAIVRPRRRDLDVTRPS
jgi:hypothetical protein